MQRGIILAFAVMFLCLQSAFADDAAVYTGQVHPDLPMLTLTVTDTGERIEKTTNRNILQVAIKAQDGSLTQTLTWESIESPAFERIAPLVRLVDMNFDGYSDPNTAGSAGRAECVPCLCTVGRTGRPVQTGGARLGLGFGATEVFF